MYIAGTMTTKAELLQTIRKHCLTCCDGSYKEVELCSAYIPPDKEKKCALYPYRFGIDPSPNKAKVALGKKYGFDKKQKEADGEEGA